MNANRWPELPVHVAQQVEAALAHGQKIEAIKLYRQATNCGLKEAKDAIEGKDRIGGSPAVYTPEAARKSGGNFLTFFIALIVIAVILIIVLMRAR